MCNKKGFTVLHQNPEAATNKIAILNLTCAEIKVDVSKTHCNENNIEHFKIVFSTLSLTMI